MRDDAVGSLAQYFVFAAHECDAAVKIHRKHLRQCVGQHGDTDPTSRHQQHRSIDGKIEARSNSRARRKRRRKRAHDGNPRDTDAVACDSMAHENFDRLIDGNEPAIRVRTCGPHAMRIKVSDHHTKSSPPFTTRNHAAHQLRGEKVSAHNCVWLISTNALPHACEREALNGSTNLPATSGITRTINPTYHTGSAFDEREIRIAIAQAKQRLRVGNDINHFSAAAAITAHHRLMQRLRRACVS